MWITGSVIQSAASNASLIISTQSGTKELFVHSGFSTSLDALWKGALVSVKVASDQNTCSLLCVEPHHVIDITELSECITASGDVENLALLRRFNPRGVFPAALRGSAVNYMFDVLVATPELSDAELLVQVNKRLALQLAAANNQHFADEITVFIPAIRQALATWQGCSIRVEPHVISAAVGLQGRFDILVKDRSTGVESLVELKTGSAPTTIRTNHAAQVSAYNLLYELLVGKPPSQSLLWYITDTGKPFRAVPPELSTQLQQRIMSVRNRLVSIEHDLGKRSFRVLRQLSEYSLTAAGPAASFEEEFADAYKNADVYSRTAAQAWISLLTNEQFAARVGSNGTSRSTADLWRQSMAEKETSPAVLYGLRVLEEGSDVRTMHLKLVYDDERTRKTATALRKGDLVLLHSSLKDDSAALEAQTTFVLLKGIVRDIGPGSISVTIRNKQANVADLLENTWTLEADVSDAGIRMLYPSIIRFLQASAERRHAILGITQPRFGPDVPVSNSTLQPLQQHIVSRALASQDWFLIQGPPGTGKTSVILRTIVNHLVCTPQNGQQERLLVLAYTNRAVNEICTVLQSVLPKGSMLRHGSSYTIGSGFDDVNIPALAIHTSPADLAERIRNARCIVSTIHAVHSHPEILTFGNFTTAIIDEASQVLDVHLAGILACVQRHILIGDQAQLPPVLQQSPAALAFNSDLLRAMGYTALGDSIFERLVQISEQNKYQGAMATLRHQGRMHHDIMQFPSKQFYAGRLETITGHQQSRIRLPWHNLLPHRSCYINAPDIETEVELVTRLAILFAQYGSEYTLGIIGPFRTHNRNIINNLSSTIAEHTVVDTVERYQGSQRSVIIYSPGAHHPHEVDSITSPYKGTDRKLNVAITRAQEQFVLVGNAAILSANPSYAALFKQLPTPPQIPGC
ncbi:MAG: AAA family ATPase [Flavobacteriales bacterium]|nr:MAG: ATP-dependent RecD-like DNA helicase [Chlorobi bacterium OLB6]MBE2266298.1 AAA family ATPase [Flavobacteriales bacterium]MBV6464333.1 hypothetical protein [Chlorobiota bacterium]MBW7854049.1 AAA family ATPase [Candidatus Kapabacteria bacterium]MCC6331128.1 AAA family ATPase [Ignavibacteria bacterium]